eukprot:scaffold388_cov244-Pinguiococcus_pyrenoidosus.AAC.32
MTSVGKEMPWKQAPAFWFSFTLSVETGLPPLARQVGHHLSLGGQARGLREVARLAANRLECTQGFVHRIQRVAEHEGRSMDGVAHPSSATPGVLHDVVVVGAELCAVDGRRWLRQEGFVARESVGGNAMLGKDPVLLAARRLAVVIENRQAVLRPMERLGHALLAD